MKTQLVLVVAALVSACGSSGGSGGDGGPSGGDEIALADLGPKTVAAGCAFETRCGVFADTATCTATSTDSSVAQLQADVAAGKIVYDGSSAAECLDAVSNLSCDTINSITLPPACDATFKGNAADGTACFINEDCMSAICTTMSSCTGTCATVLTDVAVGGTCDSVTKKCATGLYCSFGTSGGTCAAEIAAGQECTLGQVCVAGGVCNASRTTGMGTCVTSLPAEGATCDPTTVFPCDSQLDYCDATSTTCTPRKTPGAACTGDGDCVAYAECMQSMCVAKSNVGGPCGSVVDCLGSLQCASGTCQPATPTAVCM